MNFPPNRELRARAFAWKCFFTLNVAIATCCLPAVIAGDSTLPIDTVFPVVAAFPGEMIQGTEGDSLVTVTPAEWTAGVLYPHCRSWSEDGRWLFFCAIPGTLLGNEAQGDIWILAADMETRKIHRIATIPNPAAFPNKQIFNQADVSPEGGRLVYFQRNENAIHVVDLHTGEERRVFVEENGTLGEPPSISPSGDRIAWFSRFMEPPGPRFGGYASRVFYMDLEPVPGVPKVVYTFSTRNVSGQPGFRNHVSLSHVQLNPADNDVIAYCRGSYAPADGSDALSRMWMVRTPGPTQHLLARTEVGRFHTHELWSDDGEWMYFIDTGDLARVHRDGGEIETLATGLIPGALHLSMSRDNSRIAYDARLPGRGPSSPAEAADYPVEIWSFDTGTNAARRVALTHNNERFHSHAHPKISPNGSKIAFTAVNGSRCAVVVADLATVGMKVPSESP